MDRGTLAYGSPRSFLQRPINAVMVERQQPQPHTIPINESRMDLLNMEKKRRKKKGSASKFVNSLKTSVTESRNDELGAPHRLSKNFGFLHVVQALIIFFCSLRKWKKIPMPFLGKQRVLLHSDHIQDSLNAGDVHMIFCRVHCNSLERFICSSHEIRKEGHTNSVHGMR
jgi:hypothetical protein